jgi:hypothetical protein
MAGQLVADALFVERHAYKPTNPARRIVRRRRRPFI